MTYFSSETRKIWSLSVWICPPEFLLMFYFNFQKCVSSPTRYERRRMSTFWCGWGLCLQSSMHKRTNHESNERWKTLKTVGNIKRGECWFECYLVPRDNHCIFSSLKWKISCHGSVSTLCLCINNCHLIFLIFYCIRLIDPATCSWAGLLSFLNRCCIYLIVNGTKWCNLMLQ